MEGYKQEKPDTLYHLIQSLSGHELSRVTEYARMFDDSASQNHMQMFRFLRDADRYDHNALKAVFPGKHVSRIKNYLHRFIYKALAVTGLHDHNGLTQLLSEIHIAYAKDSPFQAISLINEAKDISRTRELFLIHLQLLDFERKFVLQYEDEHLKGSRIEQIWEEYEEMIQKKKNYDHYLKLKEKYYYPIQSQALQTTQVDPVLLKRFSQEEAMRIEKFPLSNRAKIEQLALWTICHRGLKDFKSALEKAEQELEVFTTVSPWLQVEEMKRYFLLLNRVSLFAMKLGQKDKARRLVNQLFELDDDSYDVALFLWSPILLASCTFATAFHDEILADKSIQFFEKWHSRLVVRLQKKEMIRILFFCLRVLFEFRRFKRAKWFASQLVGLKDYKTKGEMQIVVRVIHLIILYEENDHDGLESHGRNYQRFIKKIRGEEDLGYFIVRFLRYSPRYKESGRLPKKINDLANIVEAKKENPLAKGLLNHFNFKKWLDEKLK